MKRKVTLRTFGLYKPPSPYRQRIMRELYERVLHPHPLYDDYTGLGTDLKTLDRLIDDGFVVRRHPRSPDVRLTERGKGLVELLDSRQKARAS